MGLPAPYCFIIVHATISHLCAPTDVERAALLPTPTTPTHPPGRAPRIPRGIWLSWSQQHRQGNRRR